MTSVIAQDNTSISQPQSQTQDLANLLYQADLQLTPSHLTPFSASDRSPAMPSNAFASVLESHHQPNNLLYAPHSSQQED